MLFRSVDYVARGPGYALFVEVGAHVGTGIVVDRRGNVWVADTSRNRLWRIETNGKLTQVASDIHSNVLALAPDGGVYVENDRHTDRWATGLLHVDAQGRVLSAGDSAEAKTLTETRARAEHSGLSNVNSMVRACDGSLFVRACNSLYRVATDGKVTELPGGNQLGQIPVRGRDHPHVHLKRQRPPDRSEEHTSELQSP